MENEVLEPDISGAEFESLTPFTEMTSTAASHAVYIINSSTILLPVSI
jgi:hypothetical protein